MTERERAELRQLIFEARRAMFARTCSRCSRQLEAEDLSPGRAWCRPCEAERRKRCWHAARDRQQVAA